MNIVMCWKCTHGLLVREQGQANGPEKAVCTLARVIVSDPRKPPKACTAVSNDG